MRDIFIPTDMVAKSVKFLYPLSLTGPFCSSHVDALWAVDASVSPSKPPQGGFAVSEVV
jgi:hypothetical protein